MKAIIIRLEISDATYRLAQEMARAKGETTRDFIRTEAACVIDSLAYTEPGHEAELAIEKRDRRRAARAARRAHAEAGR